MEAIAGSKVLFLNSNALSKSFIRYHHHHHHMFVCYLQSRDNPQLKLVKSQETHIVKPVLKALPLKPKPKQKQKRKLAELVFTGGVVLSLAAMIWIEGLIIPRKLEMITDNIVNIVSSCSSSFEDLTYAYGSGEPVVLMAVMITSVVYLDAIHEEDCIRNRKNAVLKVFGPILICVFVGCSLRLVFLAHVKDTLLTTGGHGPWNLTSAVFVILLNISFLGTCFLQCIREQEDRVNTQIHVGSGTQAGDLKSRKRSRKPREKSKRRGKIVLNKHLGRVSGLGGNIRSVAEEEQ